MDPDSTALDPEATYQFRLRLDLGGAARAQPPGRATELARTLRAAAAEIAGRVEAVAAIVDALGARGWRPDEDTPPAGRGVRNDAAFSGPSGPALPDVVLLVREARPAEVAGDLAALRSPLAGEVVRDCVVRADTLDLPLVMGAGGLGLRYTPREYLETFAIRG
ncbi:MAG TPA: hypothetical protein VIA06_24175 [Candidatus Dormibacteraeota bacterium]|jgi:hypothetical protein|nr:hypothetical protein [Candidatus Dormibacteraeota bacterium]